MSSVAIAVKAGFAQAGAAWTASIRRTFSEHIPLYVCAVVFGAASIAIALYYHLTLPLEASTAFLDLVPEFLVLLLALAALHRLVVIIRSGGSERPLADIGRFLSKQIFAGERPGNVFHTLVTLTPLMITFAAMKDEIPLIHPFAWDQTFMHWDRVLGFGVLPWQILQPMLGHPIVTAALNGVYDLWFAVMFAFLFWQAFSAQSGVLRMQFLLAFAFEWFIGGNILAAVFSSAGPCFYGHLFHHDPYAAQMHYLHQANLVWPIWSVKVQDMLWQSYVTGSGVVSGISAMPSMHVMSSVMMTIAALRINKWLGWTFATFTGLIVIGSIALGWHYAVDAIAGMGIAILFWTISGAAVRAAFALNTRGQAAEPAGQ